MDHYCLYIYITYMGGVGSTIFLCWQTLKHQYALSLYKQIPDVIVLIIMIFRDHKDLWVVFQLKVSNLLLRMKSKGSFRYIPKHNYGNSCRRSQECNSCRALVTFIVIVSSLFIIVYTHVYTGLSSCCPADVSCSSDT